MKVTLRVLKRPYMGEYVVEVNGTIVGSYTDTTDWPCVAEVEVEQDELTDAMLQSGEGSKS